MRDSQMFDILQNLDKKVSKKQNLNESAGEHNVSSHTTIDVNGDGALQKNNQTTMRGILDSIQEGLDANQRKVNQMPGPHKMRKAGAKKHPAGKFLVGGEEGEPAVDTVDTVDDTGWGDEMIEDLKLLQTTLSDYGAISGIDEIISKYEQTPETSDSDLENEWDADMEREGMGEARGRLQGSDRENDDWEPAEDERHPYERGAEEDHGIPDLERDLEKADYFNDPMNKRQNESADDEPDMFGNYGTDQADLPDPDGSDIPDLERDLEKADSHNDPFDERQDESAGDNKRSVFKQNDPNHPHRKIRNTMQPGDEMNPKQSAITKTSHQPYFDIEEDEMEESYDPETMSFRKMSVTEDEIEEDTIADKATSRKSGLHGEKASFKDVFRSMSENDEDKEKTLEQELHTEITQNTLKKNEKGTYNLTDSIVEGGLSKQEIIGKIKTLKQLMSAPGRSGNDERQVIASQLGQLMQQLRALQSPEANAGPNPNDPAFNRPPEHSLY